MTSPNYIQVENLGELIRSIVKASRDEAANRPRVSYTLSGNVEDLDEALDTVWIRTDGEATGSDPRQSDNYGAPGVIPAARNGEAFVDEQVRLDFSGSAGASATRTSIESRIVLPYGAEEGRHIVLDGEVGAIGFYNEDNILVGYLDDLQWFVGTDNIGKVRLDPIGGVRLWDQNSQVRVLLSAEEGLQVRDAQSGISGVTARHDGIIVADPSTGETISITSGGTSAMPPPRWASTAQNSPGSSHSTPAIASFGTGDDLDIRFVSASAASALGTHSYTPPVGWTEQTDINDSGTVTLANSVATRDPAQASPGVANFTNTSSSWTRRTGHTVVVRGGGTSSPAINAVEAGAVQVFTGSTISLNIDMPATVADGDLVIAHVDLAGSAIPVGWTVPPGWIQLGVQAAGVGTSHILGSGVWYKRYATGDPMSETVLVNMTAAASTKVQATLVAVSNPYVFPTGLDIRRNNRSMPRGIVKQTRITSSSAGTNDFTTSYAMTDVPLLAGRTYEIALHTSLLLSSASGAGDWDLVLLKDGVGIERMGSCSVYCAPNGTFGIGAVRQSCDAKVFYVPAADEVVDFAVRADEILTSVSSTFTLEASATQAGTFTVSDMGAVY